MSSKLATAAKSTSMVMYVSALLGGTTDRSDHPQQQRDLDDRHHTRDINHWYNASATVLSGNGGITVIGTGAGTGVQIFTGFDSAAGDGYRFTGPVTIGPKGILKIDDLHNAGVGSSLGALTTANPAANLVFNGGTLWSIAPTQNAGISTNRNYTLAKSSTIQSRRPERLHWCDHLQRKHDRHQYHAGGYDPEREYLIPTSYYPLAEQFPKQRDQHGGYHEIRNECMATRYAGNTGNTYSGPDTSERRHAGSWSRPTRSEATRP